MEVYAVSTCNPNALGEEDLAACLSIIKSGNAVDVSEAKLRAAHGLALVRVGREIVGVGAIKRIRPRYAETIARRSKASFCPGMRELGYVAVDSKHRRRHLSRCLVQALLDIHPEGLFATTSNDHMKETLKKAGFRKQGVEWNAVRGKGRLSLWIMVAGGGE